MISHPSLYHPRRVGRNPPCGGINWSPTAAATRVLQGLQRPGGWGAAGGASGDGSPCVGINVANVHQAPGGLDTVEGFVRIHLP